MKRTISSIAGSVLILLIELRVAGADAQPDGAVSKASEPAPYPWSESSDYARVPKSFLSQITIRPVTMLPNAESRQFVLTGEFVQTFKLTPTEVERMTTSLADALHQYRMEEGKHLVATNEEVNVGPPGRGGPPPAVEKFTFQLVQFPEEARAIRRRLQENVLKILGEERSKFFWQSEMMLESEMSTFSREFPIPSGMVRTTTFTYQFTDHAKLGPLVDLYKSTQTRPADGRRGGGGGMGGFTYTAPLDQYAPESLKPALARWRKAIAEGTVKNLASAEKPDAVEPKERVSPKVQPPRKAEAPVSSVLQAKSSSASAWDDKSPFVDLPKSIIKSLRIAGLAPDGGISAEAVTLFGLKPEEEKAVRALYDQMKLRFEQVERANFARTEPGKNSFVIRAFPEQATALQQEWTEKLKELVGKNRGELLDDSIRTQASPFPLMGRGGGRGGAAFADPAVRIAGFLDRGQDWFRRGTAEVQITISPGNPGRDGQPTYRIESRTQGEGGGGGSWSGRPDQAPERWRHLLTPDVLGVSLNL